MNTFPVVELYFDALILLKILIKAILDCFCKFLRRNFLADTGKDIITTLKYYKINYTFRYVPDNIGVMHSGLQ
jgi:hypothetical protein